MVIGSELSGKEICELCFFLSYPRGAHLFTFLPSNYIRLAVSGLVLGVGI